jgi:hypothetical protein
MYFSEKNDGGSTLHLPFLRSRVESEVANQKARQALDKTDSLSDRRKKSMKSKGETLRELVQSRLPHVSVFWDPEPGNFFEKKPCMLIAVNLKNPKMKGSINYKDGIAEHSVEILADDFVAQIGPKVVD